MSSPSRYRASSPVRTLQEKYYTRPLETILQENNTGIRLSNSLIYQNQCLQKQNQRLVHQYVRTKDGQTSQYVQNLKLKKEKEQLEYNIRSIQARSTAQNQLKQRQIQSQQREVRLIREEYGRQNQALREQISNLSNKIGLIQANKRGQLDDLKRKCLSTTAEQTEFVRRNMSDELRKVIGELDLIRQLLSEKQRENQHLIIISQQNSAEYTANLQTLITENNILRSQLIALEVDKNKQIQTAQNKKELQKSRTIGILSYCKENSYFMEKELTKLAEQLLQKNISIESFTKELLKQRKQSQNNEKKYEQKILKLKADNEQLLKQKQKEIAKLLKIHKDDIASLKTAQIQLQEELATRLNELDNLQRQLAHCKEQINIKDKQLFELKDNVNRMHEDHSKELSKVMLDSRVKRRSGLNISSYSSSSLKDIQEAQGSSIIKTHGLDRKNSYNNYGSGSGLPIVKQQLAVSHGKLDEDDESEDIQIKQLILHYEGMIDELKKNKTNELELANQKIQSLKVNLQLKQQEIIEVLNKFSPLMELKVNKQSIEEERRAKIQQSHKADISILDVLLQKYQIVSLRKNNK